jgi:hypothetical protein
MGMRGTVAFTPLACLQIVLDKRRRKSEYWFIIYLEPLDALDC